ncbi:hypothetical protein BASA81_007787 [Batrachochytrium salamandrivorans]|nr:hypothetical protein BASA81_007787 [Batrachochytrium salamandrivorans]
MKYPKLAYMWTQYFRGKYSIEFPSPTIVTHDLECVKVSASASLTLGMDKHGSAFALGTNRWGQCGVADFTGRGIYVPTPIHMADGDKPVLDICAGSQFGVACDEDGDLFTWGKGEFGQLGQPFMLHKREKNWTTHGKELASLGFAKPEQEYTPQLLAEEQLVERELLRKRQFDVVDANGQLVHSDREVGVGAHFGFTPVRLKRLPGGVKKVSAGFAHSLSLTKHGKVYVWGRAFGLRTEPISRPILVRGFDHEVVEIACGQYFNVALDCEGNVYQWGLRPDHLGGGYIAEPTKVKGVPPGAHSLACGMQDASILCNGQVYQWDWYDLTARQVRELAGFNVKQYSFGWLHGAAIVEE